MASTRSGTFSALAGRPDLITLVVTMGVGTFGTGVAAIAFTYVAYEISGSLTSSVLVTLVCALPSVLLVPFTSRTVQRLDVRIYLIVVLVCSAITHVVYAILITRGWLSLPFLFVASLLTGTITALTTPGWTMLARQAVPNERLDGFNALVSSSTSIGAVIGLLAGGVLYRDHGAAALFIVNTITGLTLAVGAALTRVGEGSRAPSTSTAAASSMSQATVVPWPEMARKLSRNPVIRAVVITQLILLVLAWPLGKLLPQVAHDVSDSSVTYSWLVAAFNGGAALVGYVLQRQTSRRTHASVVLRSLVAVTVCMVAIALSGLLTSSSLHLIVLVILLLVMGLMLGQLAVINSSAIEIATPVEMRGQMFAFEPGATELIQVVAALGIAAIVDHMSVWLVILVMAALLGAGVWLLQSRHWWDVLAALDTPKAAEATKQQRHWQPWNLLLSSFPRFSARSGTD